MLAENHTTVKVDFSDSTSKEVSVSNESDGLIFSGVFEQLAKARVVEQFPKRAIATMKHFKGFSKRFEYFSLQSAIDICLVCQSIYRQCPHGDGFVSFSHFY